MIVVSDTSPINYLVILGYVDVLPRLFGTVIIPQEVVRELTASKTPQRVQDWVNAKPDWLEIRSGNSYFVDDQLAFGESFAIGLALEINSDLVLIDEMSARAVAEEQGLTVIGIVGVLERAHQQGFLDLTTALAELKATTFYISDSLIKRVIDRNP